MSQPIGPGDWVECTHCAEGSVHFSVGAIYRVETVGVTIGCNVCGCCTVGLTIVGKPRPCDVGKRSLWISGCCFRPVYRPDETLTERLMEPLPEVMEQVHA